MQFSKIKFTSYLSLYGFIISVMSTYNPITTYLGYMVMIGGSAVYYLSKKFLKFNPELVVLFLFPLWAVLSFINGGLISESISETRKVIFNFILILPFIFLQADYSKLILKMTPIYGVIPAVISFFLFVYTGMHSRSDFLGGPNFYGPIAAMMMCLAITQYFNEKRFFWLVIILGLFLGLVSTVSGRSFLFVFSYLLCLALAFLIRKLYSCLINFNFKVTTSSLLKLLLLSTASLMVVFSITKAVKLYEERGTQLYWVNYAINKAINPEASGNEVRFTLYETGVRLIESKGSFFIGEGLDSTRYFFISLLGKSTYSHNNYIELIIGVGWFGAFLWLVPFFLLLVVSINWMLNGRKAFLISASIFSFVLSFLLLGGFMATYSLVLPLIILLSLYNIQRKS